MQTSKLKAFLNALAPYAKNNVQIVLWFMLAMAVLIFGLHAILSDAHPYPLDYGEAPLINQAMHLANGENIYRPDLSTPPFTIANYPPLYVVSLIPFVNGESNPFQAGRLISTIATLASAAFLGLTVLYLFKNRLAALTTTILFLSFPYVVEWSSRARIDNLALACATAAIFIFAKWPRAKWAFFSGGLLLIAAAYTRQSYALAAPLAVFIWLWSHKKIRSIQFALLVGGVGGLLFLMINSLTGGGFFYNIVTANVNEFGWERLQNNLKGLWQNAGIILVLSLVFLGAGWKYHKSWRLLAGFLVGAFLSGLTIGKIGSNVNYFLELAAALSLVGGAMLAWSQKHAWRFTLVTLLIGTQIGMLMESTMGNQVDWILSARRNDFTALQRLEQEVQNLNGPVPADEYMGMLTLEKRPLYIQPFEVSQLANDGQWDQTPFLTEIEAQTFEGILIHHFGPWPVHQERWTPEMLAAIEENYRPVKTLAGSVVFQPQGQTGINSVPAPTQNSETGLAVPGLQTISTVTSTGQWSDAKIAVNPNQPHHVAVITQKTSQFDCQPPNCKIELVIYISEDGGQTWSENTTFSNVNSPFENGLVVFDAQDNLHALGVRGGTIVHNQANRAENYNITRSGTVDVTRAQVVAKPWLQVHPQTGQVFISFDAQEDDMLFVTPSLLRSTDFGSGWSTTSRTDQHISVTDFSTGRATWPDDIQVLFGSGNDVSLVWTWGWEPWSWPRTVWLANSTDGGETFGEPAPILETWGPINTASANGKFAIAYRVGDETNQQIAVTTSADNGQTWDAAIASGKIPLYFDANHGAGISISPNGTIDLVFLAHDTGSLACVADIESWRAAVQWGQIDPCNYNIFYTYSKDGIAFSQPVQLNQDLITGDSLTRFSGRSEMGTHLSVAATDDYAYPVWIGTPTKNKTQVYMVQIQR